MTDITNEIVRLGNPAADYASNNSRTTGYWSSPWTARNPWDLQEFEGIIYIGVGDWSGQAGPVPFISYDPSDGQFHGEENGVSTVLVDAIERFCVVNGSLCTAAVDPTGADNDKLTYYQYESGTWRKYKDTTNLLQNTIHNLDMAYWDGDYWIIGSVVLFEQASLGSGGSGGVTWTYHTGPASANSWAWKLFTLGANLYVAGGIGVTGGGGTGTYLYKVTPGSRTYGALSGSNYAYLVPGVASSAFIQTGVPCAMFWRTVNFPDGDTVVYLVADGAVPDWPVKDAVKWADGGSPASILSTLQGVRSGFIPTDLLVVGSTLYFLGYYTASGSTWNSVISTTDLSSYTEEYIFKSNDVNGGSQGQAFARSFEYLDGVWYFGMGNNYTTATANTGDILAYDTDPPFGGTVSAVVSASASLTVRKPLAAVMNGVSLVGLGLTVGVDMAGSFSDYLENKILDLVFNGTAFTPPATYYAALYTAAPSDSGGGTEVSTGVWTNYARIAVTKNTTNFPAASGGAVANGAIIDFGTATISGTAPVVAAIALLDASSAGNLIAWADLTVNKTINNTDPVSVAIGDLDITLT
jgi:hypothetical protein